MRNVSERTGGINVAAPAGGAGAVDALTIAGNAFVPQHRATGGSMSVPA